MFLVCVKRIFPSCKCVLASTLCGGLKLNTACRHWMQLFMSGGFDVRKCSAKPSKEIYQASCVDAILTFLLGGNDVARPRFEGVLYSVIPDLRNS